MDKIFISGGTGFVGHWLQETQPEGDVMYAGRDVYERGYWPHVDYIIHAAPIAPTRVIEVAKFCGARVLYISSGIVYHPENDTQYRRDKMRWEQECLDSGVDVVIARLFTFYGDKLDEHKAYTQFKKAALAGEPLRIWGDGSAVRSYMHGAEMARWLWAILLRGESGQAYDVGSDEPETIYELAVRILKEHDRFGEVIIENRVPDPMPVYLPVDTAKTKRLLESRKP